MSKLDITKMLTVSTAHVTESTFNRLTYDGRANEIKLPVYTKSIPEDEDSFGLYVYLDPNCLKDGKIPEDLMSVIQLAQKNDCGIICLDCDGPEIEELPIYEWKD